MRKCETDNGHEIACQRCGNSWVISDVNAKALELFRECSYRLTADTLRSLSGVLGLGMIESKKLARHVTDKAGICFSCGSTLLENSRFVKVCERCGALNLDVHDVY